MGQLWQESGCSAIHHSTTTVENHSAKTALPRRALEQPSYLLAVRAMTPATAIRAPINEYRLGCSPSNTHARGMTTIGVIAMIGKTMPVGVVSKARCMQLTPRV